MWPRGCAASLRPRRRSFPISNGVNGDALAFVERVRVGGQHSDAGAALLGARGRGALLLLYRSALSQLAAAVDSGCDDDPACGMDGPRLEFVSGDSDADAALPLLDVSLRFLAHLHRACILPRSGHALDRAGRVLRVDSSSGGVLCLRGASAGVYADAVAAGAQA